MITKEVKTKMKLNDPTSKNESETKKKKKGSEHFWFILNLLLNFVCYAIMDYFTDEGEHSDHSEFDELEQYIINNPSTDEDDIHNNTDEENAPIIINEREPPEDLASTSRDGTVWRNEPPSINSLFT